MTSNTPCVSNSSPNSTTRGGFSVRLTVESSRTDLVCLQRWFYCLRVVVLTIGFVGNCHSQSCSQEWGDVLFSCPFCVFHPRYGSYFSDAFGCAAVFKYLVLRCLCWCLEVRYSFAWGIVFSDLVFGSCFLPIIILVIWFWLSSGAVFLFWLLLLPR